MYGAIEIGARPPVHGLAMPRMAGDGAGRQIDATPVRVVAGHIGDVSGTDVSREIPSGNRWEIDFEGMRHAGELIRFKCATKQRRCLDPPIKVRHDAGARIAASCYRSDTRRQRGHREAEGAVFHGLAFDAMATAHRPLQDPNLGGGGIETHDKKVPSALAHRRIAGHKDFTGSVMQPETTTTCGIDCQRHALGGSMLAAHDALGRSFAKPGRHHQCRERNRFAADRAQVRDVDVRADCDGLPTPWIYAINLRGSRSGLEAGAVWAIVTADETNNVNAETLTAVFDADLQFGRVPGSR